jgi:hypothetical protein
LNKKLLLVEPEELLQLQAISHLSTKASAEGATGANSQNWKEKHCHQCSVCDPTLEIFDEVHESNPVNPLEKTPGTLKTCTEFKAPEENRRTEPCFRLAR